MYVWMHSLSSIHSLFIDNINTDLSISNLSCITSNGNSFGSYKYISTIKLSNLIIQPIINADIVSDEDTDTLITIVSDNSATIENIQIYNYNNKGIFGIDTKILTMKNLMMLNTEYNYQKIIYFAYIDRNIYDNSSITATNILIENYYIYNFLWCLLYKDVSLVTYTFNDIKIVHSSFNILFAFQHFKYSNILMNNIKVDTNNEPNGDFDRLNWEEIILGCIALSETNVSVTNSVFSNLIFKWPSIPVLLYFNLMTNSKIYLNNITFINNYNTPNLTNSNNWAMIHIESSINTDIVISNSVFKNNHNFIAMIECAEDSYCNINITNCIFDGNINGFYNEIHMINGILLESNAFGTVYITNSTFIGTSNVSSNYYGINYQFWYQNDSNIIVNGLISINGSTSGETSENTVTSTTGYNYTDYTTATHINITHRTPSKSHSKSESNQAIIIIIVGVSVGVICLCFVILKCFERKYRLKYAKINENISMKIGNNYNINLKKSKKKNRNDAMISNDHNNDEIELESTTSENEVNIPKNSPQQWKKSKPQKYLRV